MKNQFIRIAPIGLFFYIAFSAFGDEQAGDFNSTAIKILKQWETLKPGISTRKNLLEIFQYRGGPKNDRFQYPGCLVFVDVEFKASKIGGKVDERGNNLSDVISKISFPCLGSPHY